MDNGRIVRFSSGHIFCTGHTARVRNGCSIDSHWFADSHKFRGDFGQSKWSQWDQRPLWWMDSTLRVLVLEMCLTLTFSDGMMEKKHLQIHLHLEQERSLNPGGVIHSSVVQGERSLEGYGTCWGVEKSIDLILPIPSKSVLYTAPPSLPISLSACFLLSFIYFLNFSLLYSLSSFPFSCTWSCSSCPFILLSSLAFYIKFLLLLRFPPPRFLYLQYFRQLWSLVYFNWLKRSWPAFPLTQRSICINRHHYAIGLTLNI